MGGLIDNMLWDEMKSPEDKGLCQVKGLHCQETFSPTPSTASIRVVFVTAAVDNWGLRHLGVDQVFLKEASTRRSG